MTWKEPKLDWKMGDAPNDADFNRIEENIKHLNDLRGVAGGVAELDDTGKVPRQDLYASMAANALDLILRDADGRAQINDPVSLKDIANKQWVEQQLENISTVEVKTFSDTTTDIVAGGSVEKIITFDKLHKFAIVAIEGYSFYGAFGVITNAYFDFLDPTRMFVFHYLLEKSTETIRETVIGRGAGLPSPSDIFIDAYHFGNWIEMDYIHFLNKNLEITFTNVDPDHANRLSAKALIIGI